MNKLKFITFAVLVALVTPADGGAVDEEVSKIKELWKNSDAVCLDVDSTTCQDEAMDELAKFMSASDEVKEWTQKAMNGNVTFREALQARLDIIKPTIGKVNEFINSKQRPLSPGVEDLVKKLKEKGKDVFLVSGGFRSMIEPVATRLNIPFRNIYCNRMLFYIDGSYASFDKSEPTSDSGGKPRVVRTIMKTYNYTKVIMIGESVTDMEASPPAAAFIGYGGNKVREVVKKNATWYVTNFQDLTNEL